MSIPEAFSSLPAAMTVCDLEGILIEMNAAAEALFAKDGGRALIGKNLFDCHNPESQEIIRSLMQDRKSNVYSIEKHGKKRLIYQAPWFRDGECAGLVEISFEIPPAIQNFIRG
jgi:PAS domain S-box-containing protein